MLACLGFFSSEEVVSMQVLSDFPEGTPETVMDNLEGKCPKNNQSVVLSCSVVLRVLTSEGEEASC